MFLCMSYQCYIMIELTFLKEFTLIKTSVSKEYDVCHFWDFKDKKFKFELHVCKGYHDVLMVSINLSDIAILSIKGVDYSWIIERISKSYAVNLIKNIDLAGRKKEL